MGLHFAGQENANRNRKGRRYKDPRPGAYDSKKTIPLPVHLWIVYFDEIHSELILQLAANMFSLLLFVGATAQFRPKHLQGLLSIPGPRAPVGRQTRCPIYLESHATFLELASIRLR